MKIGREDIRRLSREKALSLRSAAQAELRRAKNAAMKDHWRRFLRLVDDRLRELDAVELSDRDRDEPFEERLTAAKEALGMEPDERAESVRYRAGQTMLAMKGSVPDPVHDSKVGAAKRALAGGSGDAGLERRLRKAKEALYGSAD